MFMNNLNKKVCAALVSAGLLCVSGVQGASSNVSPAVVERALTSGGSDELFQFFGSNLPKTPKELSRWSSLMREAVQNTGSNHSENVGPLTGRVFSVLRKLLMNKDVVSPTRSVLEVLSGANSSEACSDLDKALSTVFCNVVEPWLNSCRGNPEVVNACRCFLLVVELWTGMLALLQEYHDQGVDPWGDPSLERLAKSTGDCLRHGKYRLLAFTLRSSFQVFSR
jgi:hypothetical protein